MQLLSRYFGEIDIDETKIIKFENALPGFPDDKNFIIINDLDNPDNAFCWLQSTDDGMTSIVLLDIFQVMPDYNPSVNEDELKELGEFKLEDLLIYTVAVVPENVKDITVNLKAPIIINPSTKLGKQIISANEDYSIRYPIMENITKTK